MNFEIRQDIERFLEGTGMNAADEADAISRGVEILRKVKNKMSGRLGDPR